MIAAIAGSFIGLVLGGILAPVDWRLVFLVYVPVRGVRHRLGLHEAARTTACASRPDRLGGNVTFALGLIVVLVGIIYGIQPYGGTPWAGRIRRARRMVGGVPCCWPPFSWIETQVDDPDVPAPPVQDPGLHRREPGQPAVRARPRRAAVHADHLAAGHLAAPARLQLHRHPAVGRHLHAAAHRRVPARRAGVGIPLGPLRRPPFATGGMLLGAAAFVLLDVLPINFGYPWFARSCCL